MFGVENEPPTPLCYLSGTTRSITKIQKKSKYRTIGPSNAGLFAQNGGRNSRWRGFEGSKAAKKKKNRPEICTIRKIISIFALAIGEMPEWSIGPHSKCGERATVPGVRIPLSPQRALARTTSAYAEVFLCRYDTASLLVGCPICVKRQPRRGRSGS